MTAGQRPPGLRAVLFDWDGTLVNSAETSFRAYVGLFRELGIAFDREEYRRTYSPNWHRTYEALGLPRNIDWHDPVGRPHPLGDHVEMIDTEEVLAPKCHCATFHVVHGHAGRVRGRNE